jgi:glucokinase
MSAWRLVSDVGGSNVRFARSPGKHLLSKKRAYHLEDFPSFYDALAAFLDETGGAAGCAGAAIGVAGPIDAGAVKLTNADWRIEEARVEAMLGGAPALLINDLEAVALALPHLGAGDLSALGKPERDTAQRRTMLALNVGTGFGGATVIPMGEGWISHPGEPGHTLLGALDAVELTRMGDARTVEDILSGRGVPLLLQNIARQQGNADVAAMSSAEIFANADKDPLAAETLQAFSRFLGRVAGDLVLAAAAWGGVYLCGSVAIGWAEAGGGRYFRAPFEDKGPMASRMRQIYSGVITQDDVGLLGLTYARP